MAVVTTPPGVVTQVLPHEPQMCSCGNSGPKVAATKMGPLVPCAKKCERVNQPTDVRALEISSIAPSLSKKNPGIQAKLGLSATLNG